MNKIKKGRCLLCKEIRLLNNLGICIFCQRLRDGKTFGKEHKIFYARKNEGTEIKSKTGKVDENRYLS